VFLKVVYHGPRAMEELVAYDPHLVVGILGGGAGTTYDAFKLIAEAQKYGARVALFGRKINNAENQLAFVEFLRLIVDGAIGPEEAVRAYHAVLAKLNIRPRLKLEDDLTLQTSVMSYGGSSVVKAESGGSKADGGKRKADVGSASADAGKKVGRDDGHRVLVVGESHAAHKCECDDKKAVGVDSANSAHDCGCKSNSKSNAASNNSGPATQDANAPPDFSRMSRAEKLAYNQRERDRIFGKSL